jgi:DNA polymerase-3 subunit alpha
MSNFVHLHSHSQYSLLDGAADIKSMYKKAHEDGMKGLAITDHGNMFGVFQFVAEANKYDKKIKPIVGCEFYVVEDRYRKQFTKEDKDKRYHQLMLAKNAEGYKNLVKLCSLGYIDGLYGKYPRIDKRLIEQYHHGLIATTCCLGAEVPQAILKKGEEEAEKTFRWWLDLFTREDGEKDYYIELQRHYMPEQDKVNDILMKWAKKYDVKTIATNDSHYIDQKDANAHDILLCINTGEKQSTPIMKDFSDEEGSSKGKRFAFFNDQFYFKNTAEMSALFSDVPEAIDNTQEILGKVEHLDLKKEILLPNYKLPDDFTDQCSYLRHITWLGAKERYIDITPEAEERINFELSVIDKMGFAGYFLIVADFIKAGKDIGVFVGPGRGSAAGSVVAYCIGITNIDPLKYNLLFERFLNPDRKSMPDIDTDFDDEGRDKVIDYVVKKYGRDQVAQIVTYGTMAAKMSIKDVARVMDLPLAESNALAKLVPDKPGTNLNRVLFAPLDGKGSLKEKESYNADDIDNIKQLRELYKGTDLRANVLKEAAVLEGSVRSTGLHAAGIIIAPSDLSEILPVATSKDTDLWITQIEGSSIEDAGVIKMDFLGLKTLTIIRDALRLILQNHNITIDLDNLPLDDVKTYELYQRAETNATFQFESAGMQKYLRELKPDRFEDLIAMNALYRPGPMEYIPNFIKRKHGLEAVSYDLPEMQEYLEETYGITVYQEQVMLLSQKLANFSKGDADKLRKAMGKKNINDLNEMKEKFLKNGDANGHDTKILEKIWVDWEAFAQYAFNKSHSTCYALVAYQTAYLKAHYPSEFMAAVLSNNQGNLDKITFFMEESRKMGIPVLGPDINESDIRFSVNKKGEIRYALSAIKGVGEAAVESIVEERLADGPYQSVFDFAKRVNQRTVNKKSLESLAYAGAFDSFETYSRATFLDPDPKDGMNLIEKMSRYGSSEQNQKSMNQSSLFGDIGDTTMSEPLVTKLEEWPLLEKLKKEKEVVGIYISGHPLDDYKLEFEFFVNTSLKDIPESNQRELRIAGIVSKTQTRTSKTGNPFALFTLEDFDGTIDLALFGKDYFTYKNFIETQAAMLYITGEMKPSYRNPQEMEFKIKSIELLSDIKEKLAKNLVIHLDSKAISPRVIDDLKKVFESSPGKTPVKIKITENTEDITLNVYSKKFLISPTNELFLRLREMEEVKARLN